MFGFLRTIDPNKDLAKSGGKPAEEERGNGLPLAF